MYQTRQGLNQGRPPCCHEIGMVLAHRPAPPLSCYVDQLWYCQGYQVAHGKERVLPNGRFQLVIDLSRDAPPLVVGMRSQHSVIETAGLQSMMGVLFRPGGARPFFDAPADEFYSRAVPLDPVGCVGGADLRDRLREAATPAGKFRVLEDALQRRAVMGLELHPAVRYGLAEFERLANTRSVIEIAAQAGLSRRRFAQLFREQVGITPKLYCRLHRFQKVVRQIASGAAVDWADVALAGGYWDQAHMGHEFRSFSGLSPGAFLKSKRPFLNHAAMD